MYNCELIELDDQKVVSVRRRCPVSDLPDVIGRTYGMIITHLSSQEKYPGGLPFVGYFNMDMDDLDVEIGFPIQEDVVETDAIKMSKIPKGKYAQTLHVGPYMELEKAYDVLMRWIAENGYEATGVGYEYYLNDPDEVKESEIQTRLLFELKV